ncbi:glutamate racemase [Marinobacter sp. ELB17]|uniref:glutamate racemase n=1 Tax=Marinobacter sp. ELB17 TaxID=270374 RepID=UPI0000F3A042|nr:glutamate racemase [Marinobacter sp. ELB17]EAZ98970.1 glutamate racemase [Marinobacter sp. ELB17]
MNEASLPSVLVFDSGVGGLSVAASIRRRCPHLPLVYLADNAGFPYGDKPEEEVTRRTCNLVTSALSQFDCQIVVLACNTASTVALPALRQCVSEAVVGVVPAIKPAAAISVNRRIGILATPATVARSYLDQLIADYAADCQVSRIGHPSLVHWAEGLARGEPVPQSRLAEILVPFELAGVDTVVLGCTHYPLLLPALKQAAPGVRFWVDSGDAIARRVEQLLAFLKSAQPQALTSRLQPGMPPKPLQQALFSASAPPGIECFMTGLGLAPGAIVGFWGHI